MRACVLYVCLCVCMCVYVFCVWKVVGGCMVCACLNMN